MNDNLESLLKTDSVIEDTPHSDEDILKYSKLQIKRICEKLCLPAAEYRPYKTVRALQNYIETRANRERILYSEISSFVYGLNQEEQGNLETNVESLLSYASDEVNSVDENIYKIIIKIYDHFQLAVSQKNLNADTNEMVKSYLVQSIDEAKKSIEDSAKNAKNIEKEYITILGIFASIVLAFVGGLTFSTSVLQNIDAISVYRLLIIVLLIAGVLINAIYLLMQFICTINSKKIKCYNIKTFNIVLCVIAILVFLAWMVDVYSLAEYIGDYLPWVNKSIQSEGDAAISAQISNQAQYLQNIPDIQ